MGQTHSFLILMTLTSPAFDSIDCAFEGLRRSENRVEEDPCTDRFAAILYRRHGYYWGIKER